MNMFLLQEQGGGGSGMLIMMALVFGVMYFFMIRPQRKREKELQEAAARLKAAAERLDKEAPVLSDSDRNKRQRELAEMDKDFQRKQREFREDLNQRRNEELAVVLERANKVIKQIAEAEKYDIIFQEAVYASPRIDITEKVIKALNK